VDARIVVGVLTDFVEIHQALLQTVSRSHSWPLPSVEMFWSLARSLQVIGKHGILSLFFFTEPVRQALVQLEAAVDVCALPTSLFVRGLMTTLQSFALALIAIIPTQKSAAMTQTGALDVTITVAINTYQSWAASLWRYTLSASSLSLASPRIAMDLPLACFSSRIFPDVYRMFTRRKFTIP
jgi:hypothetical protein